MAPVEITEDYYAILEVPHTATADAIKKSYRRLAILLHPDKNRDKATATASFQLLNRAHETLKDENSRKAYDLMWPRIAQSYRTAKEKEKQGAEFAKAKNDRAAKEKATRDAEERTSRAIIEGLEKRKQQYERETFEVRRNITRIQSELKNIQTQEDKALAEEQERNGWLSYAKSTIFGAPKEPEGAKQERDVQRLQRLASRTIKEGELSRWESKLKSWNAMLSNVEREIAGEISKERDRATRAEREKERVKREEEMLAERKRYNEQLERERANRAAAEARAAQQRAAEEKRKKEEERRRKEEEKLKKEEEERQRKKFEELFRARAAQQRAAEEKRKKEEEKLKKEDEERQRKKFEEFRAKILKASIEKAAAEAEQKKAAATARAKRSTPSRPNTDSRGSPRAHHYSHPSFSSSSSSSCVHRGWWSKVEEGSLLCGNCHALQRRFLFQCPGCAMKACASCRNTLKPGGRVPNRADDQDFS